MNATTGERLSSPSSRVACFVEDLPPFDALPGPIRSQRTGRAAGSPAPSSAGGGSLPIRPRTIVWMRETRPVAVCRNWADAQHPGSYQKKPALCERNLAAPASERGDRVLVMDDERPFLRWSCDEKALLKHSSWSILRMSQ
jgi:hypothetical protein